MYIHDDLLNKWLKEDVPYFDLTTHALGIGSEDGVMEYHTREDMVLCGSEEIARLAAMLGLTVVTTNPSGTSFKAGEIIMQIKGRAEELHMLWKVGQNVIDFASGIATRTRAMVDAARAESPTANIVTTRKAIPGSKELMIKAVVAGGGLPHRLGTSETVLIFKQHRNFIDPDQLKGKIADLRVLACEKKVLIEADNAGEAEQFASYDIDGIQYDKFSSQELTETIKKINEIRLQNKLPKLLHLAAGGINVTNVREYVRTGADAIVTTSAYYGKPIDIGVRIEATK